MRAVSALVMAVGFAGAVPSGAAAVPLQRKAEIPVPGGVAVAVTVSSRTDAAPAPVPTPAAVSSRADSIPVASTSSIPPTTTSFSSGTPPISRQPCARRKVGGNWGSALSFCVAAPGNRGGGSGNGPPAPSPQAVAAVLADRALSLAPAPRIRVAPRRLGLVGLESYFWVDPPRPVRASAGVAGVVVTAEARPWRYIWHFGDGTRRVTTTPGTPWRPGRPGEIAHVYERAGLHTLAVKTVWEARWRVAGDAWRRLGFFTKNGTRPYRVRQVVALLVPPH
jgi:hypothetical protein